MIWIMLKQFFFSEGILNLIRPLGKRFGFLRASFAFDDSFHHFNEFRKPFARILLIK